MPRKKRKRTPRTEPVVRIGNPPPRLTPEEAKEILDWAYRGIPWEDVLAQVEAEDQEAAEPPSSPPDAV
jgi:hypothetical protein